MKNGYVGIPYNFRDYNFGSEYYPCEYLVAGMNNYYINTNILPAGDLKIEVIYENWTFGVLFNGGGATANSSANKNVGVFINGNNTLRTLYNSSAIDIGQVASKYQTRKKHHLIYDKGNISIDGDNIYTSMAPATFTGTKPIYIFGSNLNGTSKATQAGVKIYRAKFYQSDVLIADFLPAIKEENSSYITGFYNVVNSTFYPMISSSDGSSQISSSLTAPSLLPSGYEEIESLTGDGENYINLGYKPSTAGIYCQFVFSNLVLNNEYLFGADSTAGPATAGYSYGFGTHYRYGTANFNQYYFTYRNTPKALGAILTSGQEFVNCNAGTIYFSDRNGITATTGDPNAKLNLFLFAQNEAGTANYFSRGTIHYLKFFSYSNNNITTLAYFIPCRRISDGKLGVYDLVSGTFKCCATNDNFIAGKVIQNKITILTNNPYPSTPKKAARIKEVYLGIDHTATKIAKGYIGDANGKAQLWYGALGYGNIVCNGVQGVDWQDHIDSNGNWEIYIFNTKEVIVPNNIPINVDIFAVGGGGNGFNYTTNPGGGGGAGGNCTTLLNYTLSGGEYIATIGGSGGTTYFGSPESIPGDLSNPPIIEAAGGQSATGTTIPGTSGANAGGAGNANALTAAGASGSLNSHAFQEMNNIFFAGGGGGATGTTSGGSLGGECYIIHPNTTEPILVRAGHGGFRITNSNLYDASEANAIINSGAGGGGARSTTAGLGGSGIIIIRNAR